MFDYDNGGVLPPLVDADGNAFATGDDRMSGVNRSGEALAGWPYDLEAPLERFIALDCPPGDTGCMDIEFHPPLMSPQSLVYLVYPPQDSGDKGGRITVVNRDGTVRSGWPKTLQRPGADLGQRHDRREPASLCRRGRTGAR